MEPQQPNNQYQAPSPVGTPPSGQLPTQQMLPPTPQNSSRKWMVLTIILAVLLIGGAVAWFLTKDKGSNTPDATSQTSATDQSQKDIIDTEPEVERITTTHTSGLEHHSTISFEHPKDWTVTESEERDFGTYSFKNTTIKSPEGLSISIFDRDGIGGGCESGSYTLIKKLSTKTSGAYFKQFSVPGSEIFDGLKLEVEGGQWANSAHDALKEGEGRTDSCIDTFSAFGRSGIFVVLRDKNEKALSWDDIKDNEEFVRVLQSMVGEDKS